MDIALGTRLVERSLAGVRERLPAKELLESVIAAASDAAPSPIWGRLRDIDIEADASLCTEWLISEISSAPLALTGVWLGLYEVVSADPNVHEAAIHVSGGPLFPDPRWLLQTDWEARGDAPTPGLRALKPLAASARDDDLAWLVSYGVVFAYTAALASDLCKGAFGAAALEGRSEVGVACGFHDGDIALLGVLRPPGVLDTSAMDWT